MKNEILEEIWNARKNIENSENGDIDKVFNKIKEKSDSSKRHHYKGSIRKKQISDAV